MAAKVGPRWVDACAENRLSPLAMHLKAPIVVSMGKDAWRATRSVYQIAGAPPRITQAAGSSWLAADGARVFPVCHCKRTRDRKSRMGETSCGLATDWCGRPSAGTVNCCLTPPGKPPSAPADSAVIPPSWSPTKNGAAQSEIHSSGTDPQNR